MKNFLRRILVILATADLLVITGPFASAQEDCSNNAENWCRLVPTSRSLLEVSKNQSGRITCTISSNGRDIWIVNQFGERVRRDKNLQHHIRQISSDIKPENRSFELEISWPEDRETQERLRILQCIAFFYRSKHPCRTSLVNIKFVQEEDGTSAEASSTTPAEEKDINTAASSDLTTTMVDDRQAPANTDGTANIERRSVRQVNARVASLRSFEQSDIYSSNAKLSPSVLLLLFALCLTVTLRHL